MAFHKASGVRGPAGSDLLHCSCYRDCEKVRLSPGGGGRAKLTRSGVVSHCGRHRNEGSSVNVMGRAQPEKSWAHCAVRDTKPYPFL